MDKIDNDRVEGCFLGLAIGDALGAAVEFKARGTFPPVTGYRAGGPWGLSAGQWTDDTSMALALADSIATVGWDLDDQVNRYVAWWKRGMYSVNGTCFDIGLTVRAALDRYLENRDPLRCASDADSASGNGSIMRLAPVPIAYFRLFLSGDYIGLADKCEESSIPTHRSEKCLSACRYMGLVIAGLLCGKPRNEVLAADWEPLQIIRAHKPLHPHILDLAGGAYKDKSAAEIQGNGYVVKSLEAALWCFHRAENLRDALLTAVNLGDDADTTGAVVGQLAGAYWGKSGIDADLIDGLDGRHIVESYLLSLIPSASEPRTK